MIEFMMSHGFCAFSVRENLKNKIVTIKETLAKNPIK